jgi:GTPase SAR1 family protein
MHLRESRRAVDVVTVCTNKEGDRYRSTTMEESSSVVTPMESSSAVAPMDTQQPRRRIPKVQFRVLIIGRANAGKTSILQRVCETTESPVIYRGKGREEVRVWTKGYV